MGVDLYLQERMERDVLRTPIQAEGHREWLEKKVVAKAYQLAEHIVRYEEYDADLVAREILLLRDLVNEE